MCNQVKESYTTVLAEYVVPCLQCKRLLSLTKLLYAAAPDSKLTAASTSAVAPFPIETEPAACFV